jgi:hypothetical protein
MFLQVVTGVSVFISLTLTFISLHKRHQCEHEAINQSFVHMTLALHSAKTNTLKSFVCHTKETLTTQFHRGKISSHISNANLMFPLQTSGALQ